jgi:hypothetical protein
VVVTVWQLMCSSEAVVEKQGANWMDEVCTSRASASATHTVSTRLVSASLLCSHAQSELYLCVPTGVDQVCKWERVRGK